jgi:hypothetical protein
MSKSRRILLEAPSLDGVRRFVTELPKTLSLDGDAPQTWVTVTKMGHFYDPRYGEFDITHQMLAQMVENFNQGTYGQEVFLDVAHEPSKGAAAKFIKLDIKDTKLRALLEWTPYGIDAVKNRGFRYLSADYSENFTDNEKRAQHGPLLFGAGLTIRPVIKGLDPVRLSEPDESPPTLLHPDLQTHLLQEIQIMHKKLSLALQAALAAIVQLSEPMRVQLLSAFETAVQPITDEVQAKLLMEAFEKSGKTLADQVAAGNKDIKLSIDTSGIKAGLTAEDVNRILAENAAAQAEAAKKLSEGKTANAKLLADTINAAAGLDEATKKLLAEQVADLITPEMTADQVKRLAENQIKHGNELSAAKQLAGMGFARPAGSVYISVDDSNNIKALQAEMDKRLGVTARPDAERFSNTGGKLLDKNKAFAEKVLAEFDAAHGPQLYREHKMLAGGDNMTSDVTIPVAFERTVIREALYNLIGLQFVDTGTMPFASSADIPYSYRDTTAAGRTSTRVYEGGSIPRAGMIQTMDIAYPIPQKIAFEISDELRYLTSNGVLDWNALTENQRNASRIIGEDTEQMIFNEVLHASDEFGAVAVAAEAVAVADGAKTIFPLAHFPVVKPRQHFSLKGVQVGATVNPLAVRDNGVAVVEYDGTGTQGAGTYYTMDYNLGEVHFVNQLGVPTAPVNTHPITADYSYSTNVYAFNTDIGAATVKDFWNTFLYRYGLRKAVIESDRYRIANFGLMSSTVKTEVEQAGAFVESLAVVGTSLDQIGNLGTIKSVPNFRTTAPGLDMGDQRIIVGERGVTRYRMMKPWSMGELEDQRDANGRLTGKKEAYGDQFVILHTPEPLKNAYTSMALYSGAARVAR